MVNPSGIGIIHLHLQTFCRALVLFAGQLGSFVGHTDRGLGGTVHLYFSTMLKPYSLSVVV